MYPAAFFPNSYFFYRCKYRQKSKILPSLVRIPEETQQHAQFLFPVLLQLIRTSLLHRWKCVAFSVCLPGSQNGESKHVCPLDRAYFTPFHLSVRDLRIVNVQFGSVQATVGQKTYRFVVECERQRAHDAVEQNDKKNVFDNIAAKLCWPSGKTRQIRTKTT